MPAHAAPIADGQLTPNQVMLCHVMPYTVVQSYKFKEPLATKIYYYDSIRMYVCMCEHMRNSQCFISNIKMQFHLHLNGRVKSSRDETGRPTKGRM